MDPLRVLIADDHPLFRDGLRALLDSIPQAELVGEAANGAEVVRAAAELQPDVVVMDLRMPKVDGIEATRRITATSPHTGVLVLTTFEDDDSVFAAMRAGARGYLLKDAAQSDIIRAIEAVARGEAILCPMIAQRLIEYFTAPRAAEPAQALPELTNREREILVLLAKGEHNPAIARRLKLSPKTVRNNVSHIFLKLHVADRSEAARRARQAGLVP